MPFSNGSGAPNAGKPKIETGKFGASKGAALKKGGAGKPGSGTGVHAGPVKHPATGAPAGPPADEAGPSAESDAEESTPQEADGGCDCDEPGCTGCIVGAMKSPAAMNSFVGKAKAGYGKSKGV